MMKMKMKQARMQKVLHAALAAQPIVMQALMATALLGGCSDRIEQAAGPDLGGEPIVLTLGSGQYDGGATRGDNEHGHGEAGKTWRTGERFTAWFTSGSTVESAVYKITSGGTTATAEADMSEPGNRQPYFAPGASGATVRAYYPVMHPLAPSTFTVSANQVSVGTVPATGGYIESDLMYAPPQTVTAAAGALAFEHRTAKIRLRFDPSGAGAPTVKLTKTEVIGGAYRTVSIADPETLTPGLTLSDACTASAPLTFWTGNTATSGWRSSFVLPPQRICQQTTVGTPVSFLRATISGAGDVTFQMEPTTLEAGRIYDIHIYNLSAADAGKTFNLGTFDGGSGTIDFYADRNYGTASSSSPGLYQVGNVTFRMQRVHGGDLSTATKWSMTGTLQDYWMAETEVTQALYKAAGFALPPVSTDVFRFHANNVGDQKPICDLNQDQVFQLIAAVNRATAGQRPAGTIFYMPSLEQWRWAFNGGIHNTGTTFAGSNNLKEVGWNNWGSYANSGGHHHDVALLKPNALGLYDMSGNIGEMCLGTRYYDSAIPAYRWIYYEGGSSTYTATESSYFSASSSLQAGDPTTNCTWGPRLCMKPVSVGDLYFSDGSWGTKAEYPNKTPIGIVFHVGTSAKDQALGYFGGYVMALKDANTSATSVAWSTTAANYTDWQYNIGDACNATQAKTLLADLDGLTHCRTARCYRDDATNAAALPAMAAAKDYATAAAPRCSSGWYLPSIGQQAEWLESFSTSWANYSYVFPTATKLDGISATVGNKWCGSNYAVHFDCSMTDVEVIHAVDTYIQGKLGTSSTLYTPLYIASLTVGVGWHSSTERDANYNYSLHYYAGKTRLHFWSNFIEKTSTSNTTAAAYMLVRPVLAF